MSAAAVVGVHICYLSHHCNQTPNRKLLERRKVCWAHSLKSSNPSPSGRHGAGGSMAAAAGSWVSVSVGGEADKRQCFVVFSFHSLKC